MPDAEQQLWRTVTQRIDARGRNRINCSEEPVTVLNLNDRAEEVRDWAKLIGNELAENSPI